MPPCSSSAPPGHVLLILTLASCSQPAKLTGACLGGQQLAGSELRGGAGPQRDAGPMRRADARMVDLYWPRPRPHFEERLRGASWGSGEPKRQGSAAPWDLEVPQHLV